MKNEHLIEKTLQEAGVDVPEVPRAAGRRDRVPEYASDGTTLVKESYRSPERSTDGAAHEWSAAAATTPPRTRPATSADTIRIVYVYINA